MRRLSIRWIAALALLGGCITPSIPIPPPDPELMNFAVTVDGMSSSAVFTYPPTDIYRDSVVFIYNRNLGKGVIEAAQPDGSVGPTAPLEARLDDQIVVSFQREDQTVSTCIRLQDGAQSSTRYCD